MEDLILGLLFVAFMAFRILSGVRKRARGGADTGKERAAARRRPASLGGLLAAARDKLKEAAEQAEAARRAQAEKGEGAEMGEGAAEEWTPTMTLKDLFTPRAAPEPAPPEGWPVSPLEPAVPDWDWEPVPPSEPPPVRPAAHPAAPEPPPTEPEAPSLPPTSARRRPRLPADLGQAVIWSEILAPPVSLRGE